MPRLLRPVPEVVYTGPKPPPPASLLLRNQKWVVVEAEGWSVITKRLMCLASGIAGCDQWAIAAGVVAMDDLHTPRPYCGHHMGSIRWISEDGTRVLAWRASPAWTHYNAPKTRPRLAAVSGGNQ